MAQKYLLFINGEPPIKFPEIERFDRVVCTDGAFNYLKENNFPLEKLDFISGDFDSHLGSDEEIYQQKFIYTPDQDKTDFHKALEIIWDKGGQEVCVYGASGKEQDHFLGNLHTAYLFRNQLKIKFFDEFSSYYFIPNKIVLENVKGKMISLVPFPLAEKIFTKGLHWELMGESLSLIERIGTRNRADNNRVEIRYKNGALVLFIEK